MSKSSACRSRCLASTGVPRAPASAGTLKLSNTILANMRRMLRFRSSDRGGNIAIALSLSCSGALRKWDRFNAVRRSSHSVRYRVQRAHSFTCCCHSRACPLSRRFSRKSRAVSGIKCDDCIGSFPLRDKSGRKAPQKYPQFKKCSKKCLWISHQYKWRPIERVREFVADGEHG
jgi:hypothetical protein